MQTLCERRSGPVGRAAWRRLWATAALVIVALLNCTAAHAAGSRTTTVELTCGSGLIAFEPTKCQVTVIDTAPEAPSAPTGPVSLEPDSGGTFTPMPSCVLTAEGEDRSVCTVTYEATQPGERTLMASYPGDEAHAESTVSVMLAVATRGTALAVSCGTGVTVSQPASCTATVTDSATGTASAPSGTVSFSSDTTGGTFAPQASCSLTATESPAQASCSVQYTPGQLGSGAHTITATYAGDADHTGASAPAALAVSAPVLTTPPPIGTAPVPVPAPPPPAPAPAPERPKCRVKARERTVMKAAKHGAPKTKVLAILVTYACDQNASVRVGGSIAIAASGHGSKRSKAQKLKLRSLSSQAVGGAKQPGLMLMLPTRVGAALNRGAKTSASIEFTVSNANGIGVATIRFDLAP